MYSLFSSIWFSHFHIVHSFWLAKLAAQIFATAVFAFAFTERACAHDRTYELVLFHFVILKWCLNSMIFSWDIPQSPGAGGYGCVSLAPCFLQLSPAYKICSRFLSIQWMVGGGGAAPMPRGVSIPIYCLCKMSLGVRVVHNSTSIFSVLSKDCRGEANRAKCSSKSVEMFCIWTPCRFFGLSILRPAPKL